MNELKSRERSNAAINHPTRVLVVDDGITMRLFYRTVLEAAGFEVEEATNGVEGYEKVLTQTFDLMIVDINMPKMDGYSMMKAVRAEPSVRMIPTIMMSTQSHPADVTKAFEAGANYYLVKPVPPEELAEAARLISGRAEQ